MCIGGSFEVPRQIATEIVPGVDGWGEGMTDRLGQAEHIALASVCKT